MRNRILFIIYTLFIPYLVYSVPSDYHLIKLNQLDGSTLNIYQFGDEEFNWVTSEDGYTLLRNQSNIFEYAKLNSKGDMVLSGYKARDIDSRLEKERSFLSQMQLNLAYSDRQMKEWVKDDTYRRSGMKRGGFPTSGDNNLIMILSKFSDAEAVYSQEDFDDFMNAAGGTNGKGSFRDFYIEDSYGLLDVTTTVTVWVTLPHSRSYYAQKGPEFALDAVTAANNLGIDFSLFDNDEDGIVDGIALIHTGTGQESSGDTDDIWSHSWQISAGGFTTSQRTFDGVVVDAYTVQPERYGSGITTIGVMCHEFGHNLGAPDYYDTDYETGGSYHGTGSWDLMAGGIWNGSPSGSKPAHTNMYQKIINGWVEPVILNRNGEFSLKHSALNQEAYILPSSVSGEYFLLENRQKFGFDSNLPGHGLIIYHVDEMFIAYHLNDNTVNASEHQGLYPKAASGGINSSGCPFPGSGQKRTFDDTTNPNSLLWNGQPTMKPLSNITESDSIVSFYAAASSFDNPFWNNPMEGENEISLSWQANVNDDPVVLLWSYKQDFPELIDGEIYSTGAILENDVEVLYAGSNSSIMHQAIANGERQYYKLFSHSNGYYTTGVLLDAIIACESSYNFPYTEGFEYYNTYDAGECWSIMRNTHGDGGYNGGNLDEASIASGDNTWFLNASNNSDLFDGEKVLFGEQSIVINGESSGLNWLISPLLELPSGYADLGFYVYYQSEGDDGLQNTKFNVLVYHNNEWNNLLSWAGDNNNMFDKRIKLNLDAYLNQTIKIAFVYEGTDAYPLAIDQVEFKGSEGLRVFDVEFYAIYEQEPVEGVEIFFNDKIQRTNTSGKIIFRGVDSGEGIYYLAQKDGYLDYDGALDISEDLEIVLSMYPLNIFTEPFSGVQVSPNPVSDVLTLSNKSGADGQYILYNFCGQIILMGEVNQKEIALDVSGLSCGVYYLKIETSSSSYNTKIVKQ